MTAGFVNPPLAATAIGVVEPQRAGMASGVNTTFRQIGIAVSIAALGTIFSSSLRHDLGRLLAPVPQLKAHAQQVIDAVRQGQTGSAFSAVPKALRAQLGAAVRSSFASGINELLYVTGALALVGVTHPEPGFRPPPTAEAPARTTPQFLTGVSRPPLQAYARPSPTNHFVSDPQ